MEPASSITRRINPMGHTRTKATGCIARRLPKGRKACLIVCMIIFLRPNRAF